MAKIKIKSIEHKEMTSKAGKQYTSCKLIVSKRDGKNCWISGFGSSITKTWNPGDTVDIDVSADEKGYWSFQENSNSAPSKDPVLTALEEIRDLLREVLTGEKSSKNNKVATPTTKTLVNEASQEKTPFQQEVEDLTTAFGGEVASQNPDDQTPDFLQ